MKISIGLKLALLFSICITVLLMPIRYVITYHTQQSIQQIIEDQFCQSRAMAQNHFNLLAQTTNIIAKDIADDTVVIQHFFSDEHDRLDLYLTKKQQNIGCDQIIVLDNHGSHMSQSGQLPFQEEDLSHYNMIKETYRTQQFHTAIIRQGDNFIFYTTQPIIINQQITGAVVVGLTINNLMMESLKKNTKIDFSIVGDRVMAATSFKKGDTSMGNLPIPYLEYLWLLKNPSSFLKATINGKNYYIGAEPLHYTDPSTNASIMLAYQSDTIENIASQLQRTIKVVNLSVILAIILLSFLFGRTLHKRIVKLINMTRQIKTGKFNNRLPVETSDEIGQLTLNINSMADTLSEHDQQIQKYTHNLELEVHKRTQSIETQKQYLSTILDMQPDLIIMIENQKIVFANQPFLNFFGLNTVDTFNTPEKLYSIFGLNIPESDLPEQMDLPLSYELLKETISSEVKIQNIHNNEKIYNIELTPSLHDDDSFLVIFNDITSYIEKEQNLYHVATTDALTGLPNRFHFNASIEKSITHCNRYDDEIFLVLFDLDNFKAVNDTYGHDAGDFTLKTIGIIIKEFLRESDISARWGGEEFAIILYNLNEQQAFDIVEKLRVKVSQKDFELIGSLTCSFGLTKILKNDTDKALFQRVDAALYQAKRTGKNTIITI